jgi:two-component system chemotaxis response regulator CheY
MAFNVLIVDDSAVMRAMIARVVRLSGVPLGELTRRRRRRRARGHREHWIDLVLLDVNMPVMDGEEMLRRLRAAPETAALPVIVVSTEGSEARRHALEALGVSFIRKPFKPEELRALILRATGVTPDDEYYAPTRSGCCRRRRARLLSRSRSSSPSPPARRPVRRRRRRARVAFAGSARGAAAGGALARLGQRRRGRRPRPRTCSAPTRPAPTACRDAVGEFANVVCGHVLSEAGGPEAVFRLAAPAAVAPASPAPTAATPPGASGWTSRGGARASLLEAPEALFAAGGAA